MAKFLNPDDLIEEIEDLFEEASEFLFIVSPFIKLDWQLKKILQPKKNDSDFHVLLLYGKNENNHGQSLGNDDLSFFKEFKNVEIYYHPDLHAKYYSNEYKSIVTSLNLHAFSIANNIEVGVLFERKGRLSLGGDNREDNISHQFFMDVLEDSDCIFVKHSEQKSSFFGLIKGKMTTTVQVDQTKYTHSEIKSNKGAIQKTGFCIRTGVNIPFNLDRPFSKNAFDNWVKFSNPNYPEKFCHFSGEKSNGETCFSKPVLYKNYKKAAELQEKLHKT